MNRVSTKNLKRVKGESCIDCECWGASTGCQHENKGDYGKGGSNCFVGGVSYIWTKRVKNGS